MTADPLAFLHAAHDTAEKTARAAADYNDGAEHDVQGPPGTWVLIPDEKCFGPAHPGGTLGPRIGHTNHVILGEHIVLHDPAAVLRRIAGERALLDDLLAERHHVNDGDCWYTCTAATEERDGGENCDDNRRGGPCDCGRDARVQRRTQLIAQGWGWTEDGADDDAPA